jgi:hypothetical protein
MNIRYNHTSSENAASMSQAMDKVKTQAIRARGTATAFDSAVHVDAEDGRYIYLSQEEMDKDDTGARAFACIDNGSHDNE